MAFQRFIEKRENEVGTFKRPGRQPWLWLILIAVAVGLFLGQRYRAKHSEAHTSTPLTPSETLGGAAQPARDATPSVAGGPAQGPALPDTRIATATTQAPVPVVAAALPAMPQSTTNATPLMAQAEEMERRGDWVHAREAYLNVLKGNDDPATQSNVEQRLGAIDVDLVMTPKAMPEKVYYVVKSGDSTERIARKHGTTVELVQKSNEIANPNLLKAGDRLNVFTGKFAVVVSKTRNDLVLQMNGKFFKRYRVGSGKYGKTPVGTFTITEKIKDPVWWRPDGQAIPFGDPANILGTHWMTLRATGSTPDVKGYGIHGTWDENAIGKPESAGCVRMRNSEVEELFTMAPTGTPVTIEE